MNGWLVKKLRKKRQDCWAIVLDLGAKPDGLGRRQKHIVFHGTQKEAEGRLRSLLTDADRGVFIEPSKLTLAVWLEEWLTLVKVRRSSNTYDTYAGAVHLHLIPGLGAAKLQELRPSDIEKYLFEVRLSWGTCRLHLNILRSALKLAERDGRVLRNVASLATIGIPKVQREPLWWDELEARNVLDAAKLQDAQTNALFALALDSGARKGELLGLRWNDLVGCALRIERQLLKGGAKPVFGPTKQRRARTVDLSEETLVRLKEHRRSQAELKLKNRLAYVDHGLVFACSYEQGGRSPLGSPLGAGVLRRSLDSLTSQARASRIVFHGLS